MTKQNVILYDTTLIDSNQGGSSGAAVDTQFEGTGLEYRQMFPFGL